VLALDSSTQLKAQTARFPGARHNRHEPEYRRSSTQELPQGLATCSLVLLLACFVFCASPVHVFLPSGHTLALAFLSILVFLSALVRSQCSRLCSCVSAGHHKWFSCNETSSLFGSSRDYFIHQESGIFILIQDINCGRPCRKMTAAA
jgi:hypothetical protein